MARGVVPSQEAPPWAQAMVSSLNAILAAKDAKIAALEARIKKLEAN